MRVLIIEDREALIKEYLRIFGRVLGDLPIEFVGVSSIAEALLPLLEENWEAILVDSDLGPALTLPSEDGGKIKEKLNNGFDLIRLRRCVEKEESEIKASLIIGIAPSHIALYHQKEAGADTALLKLHIPQIASLIKARLSQEQKKQ